MLARSDLAAICVTGFRAYPAGLSFDLETMGAPGGARFPFDPFEYRVGRRTHRSDALPDEILRFGVEYPDGSRATNVDEHPFVRARAGGAPEPPVLHDHGGGGGGGLDWHQSMWLWPLPGPGTLTVVCEWPAAGIPLTRTAVDTAPLLAAAARAQVVFAYPPLPEGDEVTEIW